jgi:hypothetical protein
VCLDLRLGIDVTMVANEVNKFGQIFPIHRQGHELIFILLISPQKSFTQIYFVSRTIHILSKLISESPCIYLNNIFIYNMYYSVKSDFSHEYHKMFISL